MIKLKYHNEIDTIIECPYDVLLSVQHYFTFTIKDFHIKKRFIKKWKYWNGRVKLVRVNKKHSFVPIGLVPSLVEHFNKTYGVEVDEKIKQSLRNNITRDQLQKYIDTLNLPYKPYPEQFEAVYEGIRNKKITNMSPTSSGKSFFIYLYSRWILEHTDHKVLIIVPRIQLVKQMADDFKEYGYIDDVQMIYQGQDKVVTKRIICSTWQSLHLFDKDYFEKFGCVIFDECVKKGELIKCKNGYKKIEDINIGDVVLSYNIDKDVTEYKKVLKTYKNLYKSSSYDNLLDIELENGKSIKVTPNHKIYTKNRGYVRADELNNEDDIEII